MVRILGPAAAQAAQASDLALATLRLCSSAVAPASAAQRFTLSRASVADAASPDALRLPVHRDGAAGAAGAAAGVAARGGGLARALVIGCCF